jgi:hypothetical protein
MMVGRRKHIVSFYQRHSIRNEKRERARQTMRNMITSDIWGKRTFSPSSCRWSNFFKTQKDFFLSLPLGFVWESKFTKDEAADAGN